MRRVLEPEILDDLAPDDPAAVRSRRDLQRVNRVLGARSILARELLRFAGQSAPAGRPLRVLELGCGDGSLMLAIAGRLARRLPAVDLTLLDREPVVEASTVAAFGRLGWRAEIAKVDVLDWAAGRASVAVPAGRSNGAAAGPGGTKTPAAARCGTEMLAAARSGTEPPAAARNGTEATAAARTVGADAARWDLVVANLFLHHFDAAALEPLLGAVAGRADGFVACEPRRAWLPLLGSHLIGALGVNAVTRNDAVLSVRAGFVGGEIGMAWPSPDADASARWRLDEWRLDEWEAGLFNHCFRASRTAASKAAA